MPLSDSYIIKKTVGCIAQTDCLNICSHTYPIMYLLLGKNDISFTMTYETIKVQMAIAGILSCIVSITGFNNL